MQRKKPTATTKHREALLRKRAIKRGDIVPDEKPKKKRRNKYTGSSKSALNPQPTGISTRKLQSSFVKLSPEFLEKCKLLAASLHLPRPVPLENAIFSENSADGPQLSCIRRPSWKLDQSKEEVERNEEGVFQKWITSVDAVAQAPQHEDDITMPRGPTYFERNLEVWRQLWRVTEISQIILVLIDSRCPLLHYPPSLASYLSDRKHILVLTKVDISGPVRTAAWIAYFNQHHPSIPVVPVEAYAEREQSVLHQGRTMYEPHIPQSFRQRLVDTIRQVHQELLQPPEKVRNNHESLAKWKPRGIRLDVDWDAVSSAHNSKAGSIVGGASAPRPEDDDDGGEEPRFLTIGLIGKFLPYSARS
jgi:hypothetical protein